MADEDPGHLAFVRGLPCAACGAHGVEAHHAGPRGLGKRSHDWTAIPLCPRHHREWHDCLGYFDGWDRAERELFAKREAGVALEKATRSSGIPF